MQKLVWPVGLGIDYARTPASVVANKDWIIGATIVIALAIALRLVRKTQRGLTVGGLVILAGLFPVLGFVPFAFQEFSTVADRFMYLAMLGPALALAAVLTRVELNKALAIVAAIGLVLTWLTAAQLKMWRNTDELVKRTLAMDPGSTIGHSIAGAELYRIGMPAEAARHFTAAIARDPSDPDFHYNLANALRDSHQYDLAVAEYQRAIGLWNSPNLNALNNMGITYAKMGRPDLAKIIFDHVLEIDPKNPQATRNLRIISSGVPTK
jgi:tetratricopeptide (TPR) repeat protein